RCSASTAGLAPLEWEKVPGTGPGGAVLGLGSPTKFDERGNFTVRAFKDGDVYKLYYGGADTFGACSGINSPHWPTALARPTDPARAAACFPSASPVRSTRSRSATSGS